MHRRPDWNTPATAAELAHELTVPDEWVTSIMAPMMKRYAADRFTPSPILYTSAGRAVLTPDAADSVREQIIDRLYATAGTP